MKVSSKEIHKILSDPLGTSYDNRISVELTVHSIHEIKGTPKFYDGDKLTGMAYGEAKCSQGIYMLEPYKAYDVVFEQGLKELPSNRCAMIIQRSTLNKCGLRLQGSIYNPCYSCDKLSATLYTSHLSVQIPRGTRVAHLVLEECDI